MYQHHYKGICTAIARRGCALGPSTSKSRKTRRAGVGGIGGAATVSHHLDRRCHDGSHLLRRRSTHSTPRPPGTTGMMRTTMTLPVPPPCGDALVLNTTGRWPNKESLRGLLLAGPIARDRPLPPIEHLALASSGSTARRRWWSSQPAAHDADDDGDDDVDGDADDGEHGPARILGPAVAANVEGHISSASQFPSKDVAAEAKAAATVADDGASVHITFPPPPHASSASSSTNNPARSSSVFHAAWLWSNCPSAVHPTSGQRQRTPGEYYCDGGRDGAGSVAAAIVVSADIVTAEESLQQQQRHSQGEGRMMESAESNSKSVLPVPSPPWNSCHPVGTVYSDPVLDGGGGGGGGGSEGSGTSSTGFHDKQRRQQQLLLRVSWRTNDGAQAVSPPPPCSYYDLEWLRQWRYDRAALDERRGWTEVTTATIRRQRRPPRSAGSAATTESLHQVREGCRDADTGCGSTTEEDNEEEDMIVKVDYREIFPHQSFGGGTDKSCTQMQWDADGVFKLLDAIFSDGAALVCNTPAPSGASHSPFSVEAMAQALSGSLSHGTLYGSTFHVRSSGAANNIAYTSLPLCPHQDLAYYESMPGLQLLHCVEFGDDVVGGESTLIDAMAAAHALREAAPHHFRTLTNVPATFVKQREGACMTYLRPHIVLAGGGGGNVGCDCGAAGTDFNIDREIVAVNWSPPFEGPLCCPPAEVLPYYAAYAVFERMLDDSMGRGMSITAGDADCGCSRGTLDASSDGLQDEDLSRALDTYAYEATWERRLEPGEMLIFNNRRMLHGRRGFRQAEVSEHIAEQVSECRGRGNRHLIGAYTCIDDTLNRYRVLQRGRMFGRCDKLRNVGNGTTVVP